MARIYAGRIGLYDQVAQIYDLLHVSVKDDIPFILEEAERAGGPIVELGSGTGRLLIPLARKGYKATGIEISEAMMEQARRNISKETKPVQARISLVNADLRSFTAEAQFAIAVIGYNTFMHFTPNQARSFLPRVKEMLLPDGRLIIDLANPYELYDLDDDRSAFEQIFRDNQGNVTVRMVFSSAPGSDQMARLIKWEAFSDKSSDREASQPRFEAELRYYYPHEIDLLLASEGFHIEDIYGDYDRATFDENSPRLLILAGQAG